MKKGASMSVISEEICINTCTGCAACSNSCGYNAIKMNRDEEGFVIPNIDEALCFHCGLCLEVCPQYQFTNTNSSKPEIVAAFAKDDVRMKSSSGGIFSLFARQILESGGIVYGAAYDDKMNVVHQGIDCIDKLGFLRGSKYVQSDIGYTYRNVMECLEDGKQVLFSGTPCQVAGLYKFLRNDDENLLTVDVLCHGVPSGEVFQKYLEEIAQGRVVKNVEFRNKKFGWTANHIYISFEDGSIYSKDVNDDPYIRGFLKNLTLRPSCENCHFSILPRVADISLGDFWGVSKVCPEMVTKYGTSMVLLNNSKGKKVFEKITSELWKYRRVECDPLQLPNRLQENYPHNSKRQEFFRTIKSCGFKASVDELIPGRGKVVGNPYWNNREGAVNQRYDIGLVANYFAPNFGGQMTQYALFKVLQDMGYSVLLIEHPLNAINRTSLETLKRIYIEVPYQQSDMSEQYASKYEMLKLNDICDTFVVGSDQQFQYVLYCEQGEYVALDWVADSKKKVAVAASFGHAKIWGKASVKKEMADLLKKFDAFSVREESAIRICKREYGIDADLILDPVFLCDEAHYDAMVQKSKIVWPEYYIGSYILDPTEDKSHVIQNVMNDTGWDCRIFSEYVVSAEYMQAFGKMSWDNYRTEERLSNIKNCSFFVTDSFHGTCFSIMMRKPFIAILNEKRGADRFVSLLKHFGLEKHLIRSSKDLSPIHSYTEIDFDRVFQILQEDRLKSLNWIKQKLSIQKVLPPEQHIIERQRAEIYQLKKVVTNLSQKLGYDLREIDNMKSYCQAVTNSLERFIFFIAVKDTPGMAVNEMVMDSLRKIGVQKNLINQHWHSYLGIFKNRDVVYEALSELNAPLEYRGTIDGLTVRLESKCLNAGNLAMVVLNGKDYAVNRRGINVVVWDTVLNAVVDSVCFDTHNPRIPVMR